MIKQSLTNRIKWDAAYFAAEASKEPFQDVSLITAKSAFLKLVYDIAADTLYKLGVDLTLDVVNIAVETILKSKGVYIFQSVIVDDQGITICIDAPNVENLDVTFKALDMLADALDQLNGNYGSVNFGAQLQFSLQEVISILPH